jgi:Protein of unknown function (DUF2911)
MNPKVVRSSFGFAAGLVFATGLFAQTPRVEFPAPSPACTLKQRVGLTDIEIVYSRPGVKGRAIFGGIVPYGEIWRAGANASTRISFSTAAKLNGTEVPAGKYTLYTIPGEKEWTMIIYKDATLSGASGYNQTNDLVRFKAVPVKLTEAVETFTIDINDIRDESATLNLVWEKTRVPVKLELDLVTTLVPQIEAAMSAPGQTKPYYPAAMFYLEHGQDLQKASKWIDAAMAERETYYVAHLKARILAKLGDKAGATAAAKRSTELAIKAEGPKSGYVKMNEDLISSLR